MILYDFYFSKQQKEMEEALKIQPTYINGIQYTECASHGHDMSHSNIEDYVFICTADESEITFS